MKFFYKKIDNLLKQLFKLVKINKERRKTSCQNNYANIFRENPSLTHDQ